MPRPKPKAAGPPPVTEEEFMRQVVRYARLTGWRVYHTRDSRRSSAGYPDLHCFRERSIFLELKSESGTLSGEQAACLDALRAAGQEVWVFRPSMWPEIERVLR